ncbi:hypothetical protein F8158_25500 [Bacillus cereus]|uniref:Uncharacterized protein n=1 Tax=Bacillus cereus TaxID=1396 RepID=A0AB34CXS6_BACCE|nr:hypothetical protein F8158_25500 [Bacillus cereus]
MASPHVIQKPLLLLEALLPWPLFLSGRNSCRRYLVFIKYISHVLNEKEYENKGYFCGRFLK